MGNTCKPVAVSFQCMTKSTSVKKKKKKNALPCKKKKTVNEKKKRISKLEFTIKHGDSKFD